MIASIIECALRAGALAIVVWLALLVLRVRSPKLQRSAWLAVLLSALAMPLLMKLTALPPASTPELPWLQQIVTTTSSPIRSSASWQAILFAILTGAAAVLLARQAAGIVRWWNVRRRASPIASPLCTGSDVRTSPDVGSPATVFSTILVPADFETLAPQVQRAVIAHERTHVANRDFYVQSLAQIHRSIFWFSPLAWWLPRQLSLLSEHISDDAAIAEIHERTAYAEVLLGFAARAIHDDQAVAMARATTLGARIDRILSGDSPGDGRIKALFLISALLPAIAVVAGFQTVAARTRGQAEELQPFSRHASADNRGSGPAVAALGATATHVVLPKSNPQRPLSQPVYPSVSRRMLEHGTVILKLHVLEDGSVGDAIIEESSGYPSLDYAAMYESFHWRLDPGTVDDVPSRMWGHFAVTFKLAE